MKDLISIFFEKSCKFMVDTIGGPSIPTFKELRKKFLAKYFPSSKIDKLRIKVHQFCQFDRESFSEVWETFQDLLRRALHCEWKRIRIVNLL